MRVRVQALIVLSCLSYAACSQGTGTSSGDSGAGIQDCRARKSPLGREEGASFAVRNGREAHADEFPYVGMLLLDESGKSNRDARVCSASLVCSNVVLTAAHCFDAGARAESYVFFQNAQGGVSKSVSVPSIVLSLPQLLLPGAQSAAASRAARGRRLEVLNPQGVKGDSDLALLQLDRKLTGQVATLATSMLDAEKHDGAVASIVGFGATMTKNGQDVGAGTKKVGMMRFSGYLNAPDNKTLDGLGKLYPLDGLDASASFSDNACPGDSGGATVLANKIFGVVSRIMNFRDGKIYENPTCASANITLFTPMPRHLEWINKNVQEMCADPFDVNVSGSQGAKPASATLENNSSGDGDDDC